MRHALAIAGRELRSLFSTPVAYAVLAFYLVLAGYFFFIGLGVFLQQIQQIQAFQMTHLLEQFNLNERVIGPSFGSFSIILVLLVPLVTMRSFAEERVNGTFELLLTSPVSTWEIVLGKYLAATAMSVLLVVVSALFPLMLALYGDPEIWQTLAGLVGLLGFSMTLAAIGCFASSLTKSQIIAALIAFVVGLILYLLSFAAQVVPEGAGRSVLTYLALGEHLEPALAGNLRSEDLAYFAVSIAFLLVLTRTTIESLRWR
jgi:ABC-2 type transport system permease protein